MINPKSPRVFATGISGTIGRQLIDRVGNISFTDFCRDLYLPSEIDLAGSTVIHLAGVVGVGSVAIDPSAAREVNVSKTLEFAKLCMEKRVERFVYVSSAHVYQSSDSPINEEGVLEPGTEYANQKLQAEEGLRELTKDHPLDLISLRLFSVLSLDGKPNTLGARVARALERNTPLVVPFAADRRDFLTPMAYANLVLQIANKDSVNHKIINVGSGNALSVEDAVRRLLRSTHESDLAIEFDRKVSPMPYLVADNLRLLQTLGAKAGELTFP